MFLNTGAINIEPPRRDRRDRQSPCVPHTEPPVFVLSPNIKATSNKRCPLMTQSSLQAWNPTVGGETPAVTAAAEPDTYICTGGGRRGGTEESEIKRDACGRQAAQARLHVTKGPVSARRALN